MRNTMAALRQLVTLMQCRLHMRARAPPSLPLCSAKDIRGDLRYSARLQPARFLTSAGAAGDGHVASVPSSSSGTPEGLDSSFEGWKQMWYRFLQQTFEQGHYAADPSVTPDALDASPGPMKRAVLSLARQRGDILHSLDTPKLQAVIKAGFPVDDRKTKNAHKRLQASIVKGRDLAPADGGPAELQDLMRVYLSLAACSPRDAALFHPLIHAAADLLPDIMAAAATPPPEQAAASPGTQRYMPPKENKVATKPMRNSGSASPHRKSGRAGSASRASGGRWYEGPRQLKSSNVNLDSEDLRESAHDPQGRPGS